MPPPSSVYPPPRAGRETMSPAERRRAAIAIRFSRHRLPKPQQRNVSHHVVASNPCNNACDGRRKPAGHEPNSNCRPGRMSNKATAVSPAGPQQSKPVCGIHQRIGGFLSRSQPRQCSREDRAGEQCAEPGIVTDLVGHECLRKRGQRNAQPAHPASRLAFCHANVNATAHRRHIPTPR